MPEITTQTIPAPDDIPVREIRWAPAFRIIPSRFPPIPLFEGVADPADLEAVFEIEALTNTRLRDSVGNLSLVPPTERVSGPGSSFVMGAFTHVRPEGARFNDGTFGAYYSARTRETAIRETIHHTERFHRDSRSPPMELEMRVLRARIHAELHDLRSAPPEWNVILDPGSYHVSQALGRELHRAGAAGIAYDSVRHGGGECVAVYRPRLVERCTSAEHLSYLWDGEKIAVVYEKKILHTHQRG